MALTLTKQQLIEIYHRFITKEVYEHQYMLTKEWCLVRRFKLASNNSTRNKASQFRIRLGHFTPEHSVICMKSLYKTLSEFLTKLQDKHKVICCVRARFSSIDPPIGNYSVAYLPLKNDELEMFGDLKRLFNEQYYRIRCYGR